MTRRRFLVLLGGGAVALGGIAAGVASLPGDSRASGQPTIYYGEENCAHCGMLIGDATFAAAWRTKEAAEVHFDDIGCMVNMSRRRDPGPGAHFFVHDYYDQSWLDSALATYLVSPTIKTPMAYGVAAFAHVDAAEALSKQQPGTRYEWGGLLTNLERKG